MSIAIVVTITIKHCDPNNNKIKIKEETRRDEMTTTAAATGTILRYPSREDVCACDIRYPICHWGLHLCPPAARYAGALHQPVTRHRL